MIFKNFDFVGHRNKFFILSSVITLAGIICLFIFGLNLGIDFSSGTRVDIESSHPISINKLTSDFHKMGFKTERPTLAGKNNTKASIRLQDVLNQKQIADVKTKIKKDFGEPPSVSTVSPLIGKELAKNAFWAIIISSIFIIIYVWIRFEFLQGLTAVIALIHDAFFIITVFSIFHIEVNIVFIAAVLTIVGYSINDTIVTFDRIRENIHLRKKKLKTFDDIKEVVNTGIQQTLVRSINTVLTVLIAVVALMIFGSTEIREFTIALFAGLICGVYSSIFIASPLWAVFKIKHINNKKDGKKKAQPQT